LSPDWRIYLSDMIERCDRVLAYTSDLPRERFDEHGIAYDATVRNIELLGEAARHIPEEHRQLAPAIEWRGIIAVRNILVHGYLGIDDDILWDVIRNRVPELKGQLEALRDLVS
jgi:uncharacterized protein with HEPN domain